MNSIDDNVRIKLTGAAGLICSYRNDTLLVDPYYSRLGKWQVLFGKVSADAAKIRDHAERIGHITAMVVGHSHFDHAFDIPELSKYTKGKIIGNRSLETLMTLSGIKGRTMVCKGGEVVNISDRIRITMLYSLHGKVVLGMVPYPGEISADAKLPLRAKDYKVGQVFSPKIEIGGKSFLHVGSAGFIDGSLKGHSCDVVFLCVPGWKRMKGYPQRILELTGAKTVVLFHQDDFFSPIEPGKRIKNIALSDVGGLVKKIKSFSCDVEIIVPTLYETMEF